MKKQKINIVWLKRDIRSQDHLPLQKAEDHLLPYLIIYLFEPSLIAYPDTSIRHLQFQYQSIMQFNQKLLHYQKQVNIYYTEAIDVFTSIQAQFEIQYIFSYQESGISITYERDKTIAKFCADNHICWQQFQRDGIIRGLMNRDGWDKQWFTTMHAPIVQNVYRIHSPIIHAHTFTIPQQLLAELTDYPSEFQPAGEDYAWKYLYSFVQNRGTNYHKNLSKPLASRTSCARISPYLSWGNISIKQVYQFVYSHLQSITHTFTFKNFLTRLHWHCHFIQKFEMECTYETQCVNAGYELLPHTTNLLFIEAFKQGKTGIPLVDACMRCLIVTGWLNFRMRAMLVSFFCHHLFQDWRQATYYLAQLFLDYEPGIHYPQFQMQAGTTGVNTIRMYNPVKQSQDHDPQGEFIKKWLPELQSVPSQFIHEPHTMSIMEQQLCGVIIGIQYPKPIVDIEIAGREARKAIWGHRNNSLVKIENERILAKHVRKLNQLKFKK